MAANRGVGVRQIDTTGTTPKEHRLAIAGLVAENAQGEPRSGLLNPGTSNIVVPKANMSYDILPCQAVIARSQDEGVYTPTLTSITNVATSPAPAAGSRWDLVWIKQNDPEKGDTANREPANTAVVGVTSGEAAASPVKPENSVPAGALILSEHQIFSGTASTNQSPNTSTQRWLYTVARGAPIPLRNQSEQEKISPSIGVTVARQDLGGRVLIGDGTGWASAPAIASMRCAEVRWEAGRTTGIGSPGFIAAETVNNDFVELGVQDGFRISQAGVYAVEVWLAGRTQSTGGNVQILRNGGQISETGLSTTSSWSTSLTTLFFAPSGTQVQVRGRSVNTYFTIPYLRVAKIG